MAVFRFSGAWCPAALLGLLLAGCTSAPDFTPKPRGYNRIDLPAHAYQQLAPGHPYTFEYSRYAKVLRDSSYLAQPHWINVYYPQLKASVQLTYADLKGNPQRYTRLLEDARKLTSKHEIKASAIDEKVLETPFGMRVAVFELQGEVPSQFQFYTTDSTRHFFRGALYFRTATANDSLAPVIEYVKQDVVHLLNTLQYR
ncbi:gliding motility lipoprotein GldD [Hymenobacter sp. NST-14]|uniref:gliding motility lipoprotein GldD n=1 Tax=Hymenobacter piscis TaxID=2839984 RepID=UPI001C01EA37|nr:gliding motility lipoprotein GldD [Hymenobacter piscis]MBT9394030.1 gliding motility lipoprotein GldD [Hymenobacter piscis]